MSKVRRVAQRHVRNEADKDFQHAYENDIELKCRKPGAWRYYIGFRPSERPTPAGARRLCEGIPGVTAPCPLVDACRAFAHNLPPGVADGVWGGQVWIDGVIQAD